MYATVQSSSVSINFAVIHEIIDTDSPVYVDSEYDEYLKQSTRITSWDYAYRLRVKRVTNDDALLPDVFRPIKQYDGVAGKWVHPDSLEGVKYNTILAVRRVVKVDIYVDGR